MKKTVDATSEIKEPSLSRLSEPARLKTKLTFQSVNQAYLWVTDRGRSKVIKH